MKQALIALLFLEVILFCKVGLCSQTDQGSQKIKAIKLIERQKTTFQERNWSKFFANAIYLRSWLYQDDLRWMTPGLDQAISLEILALTQHCQYDLANQITKEILTHHQSGTLDQRLILEAQEQIKLQKAFNHLDTEDLKKKKKNSVEIIKWPISFDRTLDIADVEQLEVLLKNQCVGSGT